MYLEYYGLREPPFSITPDPRFVFRSERHRDALAHLLYGVGQGGGGGFVQLTGEVGTGKTTVSRLLLEQLPDNTRAALVLNPRLSPVELLETICEELRLDLTGRRGSVKQLVDLLNGYLLEAYAQGLRVVLIIDEAQNLSVDALEQVRLLTNLETDTQKLLQIILLGQPELRSMLAREDLRQLAQRITARYHLTPLTADETEAYLRHRYRVAGGQRFPFTAAAVKRIHAHARGVPRLINVIAERALLAGYAHDESMLGGRWVDRAANEALAPARRRLTGSKLAIAATAVLAFTAAGFWLWSKPPAASAVATPIAPRVPAKPAPPPTLDERALRQRISAASSNPLAGWRELLALWRATATGAMSTNAGNCPLPVAPDLHCLFGRGDLDKLNAQGRPVLLRLQDQGNAAWAVLLGADAVAVRLSMSGQLFDIDRLTLERVWNGDYAGVWRGPEHLVAAPPQPDQGGPTADWIHARLQPRHRGPAVFDASMRDAVRGFQQARGLVADGVVGPETLLALSANDEGPRLRRVLE